MTSTTNTSGKRPSPFRDAVVADIKLQNGPAMRLGENGCPEYTNQGLGSDVLALSQLVRGGDPVSLCDKILSNEDNVRDVSDLMVLLFVIRNTRGGKGEKDLSFAVFLRVWKHYPKTAKLLLRLFPHYGYWKDLLLLGVKAKESNPEILDALLAEAIVLMRAQLNKDVAAMAQYNSDLAAVVGNAEDEAKLKRKGPGISLLAKWLPRENTHFDKKLNFVRRFTEATENTGGGEQNWQSKAKVDYRKTIAKLTTFLELPEVLLSAQRADEINFHKLASKATFKLTKTFLNETKNGQPRSEDPKRIRLAQLFLEHLSQKGLKGGQLMPHEIVQEILKGKMTTQREAVLDAQWKSLWKGVVDQVKAKAEEEGLEFNPTRMVPLSDVSYSMHGIPMVVSIALGIGISEITHPAFRGLVLTFESTPRWHKLNPNDSIVKKVRSLAKAPWGGSTNFEGAYDRILEVCVEHKLAREDVPSLIVFSDMQFNQAAGGRFHNDRKVATMYNVIAKKFAKVAKKLGWMDTDPTPIVFWNLRNTGGHPVEKGTQGAVLLSGFSPSLLKLVMNGEALKEEEVEVVEMDGTVRKEKVRVTPEEVLRKMLDDSLYDPVREVLAKSQEGALGDYEPLPSSAAVSGPSDGGFELI